MKFESLLTFFEIRLSLLNYNCRLFLLIYFTEATSSDGSFDVAQNGSLPNHAAKNGSPSVNDTEGRCMGYGPSVRLRWLDIG